MTRKITLLVAAAGLALCPSIAAAREPALVKCSMTFTLKGWSAIYKTASGHGKVTCDNGEWLPVHLTVHGGGVTFGKMDILEGKGEFSGVKSIDEVFGSFAAAEAAAGAVKAGQAAAYTKGEVSLALTGTGRGVAIGFDFGKLDIDRVKK
ncbi:MAG TPA: hypothetical protein VMT19_05995 [Thermoanaerobaculaceae bacterium]|nr:hypothetical protein [Thermoanaerobaculaceae bacterium]